MGVGIGLGCAEFPFSGAPAYWRWIDMCEAGGVDSIWQTDRIVSRQPFLESMTTMAALAGRTRRMKFGMKGFALASVGQLIERKGHHLVIGALRDLPDATLFIAGVVGLVRQELVQLEAAEEDEGLVGAHAVSSPGGSEP